MSGVVLGVLAIATVERAVANHEKAHKVKHIDIRLMKINSLACGRVVPCTILERCNPDELLLGHCRAIVILTILVRDCLPNTTIFFEHHAMESACSNDSRATGDYRNENLTFYCRPVPRMSILVVTCGPHAAILLQHHIMQGALAI